MRALIPCLMAVAAIAADPVGDGIAVSTTTGASGVVKATVACSAVSGVQAAPGGIVVVAGAWLNNPSVFAAPPPTTVRTVVGQRLASTVQWTGGEDQRVVASLISAPASGSFDLGAGGTYVYRSSAPGSYSARVRLSNALESVEVEVPFTVESLANAPITSLPRVQIPVSPPRSRTTSYQAISVPTPQGVSSLLGLFATPDPNKRRCFAWDARLQLYAELPVQPEGGLQPWHALFLATREPLPLDGSGSPLPAPFVVELEPGWNFIGIPPLTDGAQVLTAHPWNTFALQTADGEPVQDTQRFVAILGKPNQGSESARPWLYQDQAYGQVDRLDTGLGYWLKNNSASRVILVRGLSANELQGGSGTSVRGYDDRGTPPAPPPGFHEQDGSGSSGCGFGAAGVVLLLASMLVVPLRIRRRSA